MPDTPEATMPPDTSRGDRGPRFVRPRRSRSRGIFGFVFLIFLILKLTGGVDWSWWWVTAPLWIGFVLGTASFLLFWLPLAIVFRWHMGKRE